MKNKIKLSCVLPVKKDVVYKAWLSSKEHSAFTGSAAKMSAKVGGAYSAYNGYINGKNLKLEPNKYILQSWHASDFTEDAEDSMLEVLLEANPKGSKLTLIHSGLPESRMDEFKQGWKDFYFKPMKKYFSGK